MPLLHSRKTMVLHEAMQACNITDHTGWLTTLDRWTEQTLGQHERQIILTVFKEGTSGKSWWLSTHLTNNVSLHTGTGAGCQQAGAGGAGGAAAPAASHTQSRLPRS